MTFIQIIEFALILFSGLSLLSLFAPFVHSKITIVLLVCSLGLLLFHLLGFHFRWQMLPLYIVVLVTLMVVCFGLQSGTILQIVGLTTAVLLLAISFFLCIGIPSPMLPKPSGPLAVGTIVLNDEYQAVDIAEKSGNTRRLQLKVWYPAHAFDAVKYPKETLWSEFHDPAAFSLVERFLTKYLKNIKTGSRIGAPFKAIDTDPAIIIYNHSLLSMASENTLLIEALASHGYIVVGVRHKDQRDEYFQLEQNLTDEQRAQQKEDMLALGTEMERAKRAKLALKIYQGNSNLSEIVRRRAMDSRHVLSNLKSILKSIPGFTVNEHGNELKAALVGFSLGGAVATELCKTDSRCNAVVNLDGGVFTSDTSSPITKPYLMLYSPSHAGGNDFIKTASGDYYVEQIITGAMHADFHDATVVVPGLRWVGLLGKIGGKAMIQQRNRYILDFLNDVKIQNSE